MEAIHILLVEDNPADIDLTKEALRVSKISLDLSVAMDGLQAMAILANTTKKLPDLILLDLNMPVMDGWEVLRELKSNKRYDRIPVVVLTSSEADRDILSSYDLGANCYIAKPVDLRLFEEVVRSIEQFWFTVVKLPTHAAN